VAARLSEMSASHGGISGRGCCLHLVSGEPKRADRAREIRADRPVPFGLLWPKPRLACLEPLDSAKPPPPSRRIRGGSPRLQRYRPGVEAGSRARSSLRAGGGSARGISTPRCSSPHVARFARRACRPPRIPRAAPGPYGRSTKSHVLGASQPSLGYRGQRLRDFPLRHRFASLTLAYNQEDYIEYCLRGVARAVGALFVMFSERPWSTYNPSAREECHRVDNTTLILNQLKVELPGLRIIAGDWHCEEDMRNQGLAAARQSGFEFLMIVDADESYHDDHLAASKSLSPILQSTTTGGVACASPSSTATTSSMERITTCPWSFVPARA